MKKFIVTVATLTTLVMAVDIDHPHDRIEDKKAMTQEELKLEIKHIEDQLADMKSKLVAEKGTFDWFHFKGDLRLRYESIERYDYTATPEDENKYRNRYRIRLGSEIDFTDKLHLEVGMRSGYGNPTSGNQSFKTDTNLEDYFFESLRFNVLGFSYEATKNSTYKVGRQPYMMYRAIKSQLVWDNDVSLNGANYQYKDDSKIITLGVNQPTLEEDSILRDKSDEEADVNLYIAQYVQKTKLGSAKFNLGTGYYHYDGLKGKSVIFGSDKGNTVEKIGGVKYYLNDYRLGEAFAELQFKEVLGQPFKIAAGVVHNFGADTENFGYDVAFQYGEAKKVKQWQVKYSYTELQDDAAFGAYSDSDNFGGGTAARGHAIRTKYKFANDTYLAGNFFFNEHYATNTKTFTTETEPGYNRVQLDAIFKF